jgi:hypothetical protein
MGDGPQQDICEMSTSRCSGRGPASRRTALWDWSDETVPAPPTGRYRSVTPAGEAAPSTRRGSRSRAIHIDRRHAVASADHDQVALLLAVVALSVDGTLRDVNEVTRNGVDHL